MYKMIIVEDEYVTRKSLVKEIDWETHAVEVIGEAINGFEAIALLKTKQVDIIISDIKMDDMDGIELCHVLRDQWPQIKIILITGHEEFEFAQAAVKLGVTDFVLKPTDPNELVEAVNKAVTEIKWDRQRMDELSKLQKIVNESIPMLRERFLYNLLTGNEISEEEMADSLSFFGVSSGIYYVTSIEIDDYEQFLQHHDENKRQLKRLMIRQICEKVFEAESLTLYFIEMEPNLACLVVLHPLEQKLPYLLEIILERIREYIEVSVSLGISLPTSNFSGFHHAFLQSFDALKYKFYTGEGSVISYRDIHENIQNSNDFIYLEWNTVTQNVATGNVEGAQKQLDKQLNMIVANKVKNYSYIRNAAMELAVRIQRILLEKGVSVEENPIDKLYLDELSSICTLDDTRKNLMFIVLKAAAIIHERNNSKNGRTVNRVVTYMNEKYSQDISLNDIAKLVFLNSGYLCRLIKNETGKNFSSILTEIRVIKAKELLKNPQYKTYEVAKMVGINDARYFSQVFRKFVGKTPTEYREKET